MTNLRVRRFTQPAPFKTVQMYTGIDALYRCIVWHGIENIMRGQYD